MKPRIKRAGVLFSAGLLAITAALPAHAITFEQLNLQRPAGVAGLMFDDQLCFPAVWLAYDGVNQLGLSTPVDLWLTPLITIGDVIAAGTDPGANVVAGQIRDQTLGDPVQYDMLRTNYGQNQFQGLLDFLNCMADTDPAVFQAYREAAGGGTQPVDVVAGQFVGADATRRGDLASELLAAGAPGATALAGVLTEGLVADTTQTTQLLAVLRLLGQFEANGGDAAPQIVTILGDSRGTVRAAARTALTAIGDAGVAAIIPALSSDNALARLDAAMVLGAITPPPTAALTALQQAVSDPDPNVRAAAQAAANRIIAGGTQGTPIVGP